MKNVLLGSLIFVGLFNLFFFPLPLGIGMGILFLCIHLYLFLVRDDQTKNLGLALTLSFLSIIFTLFVGFRANGVVQALDILLAMYLTLAAGYYYKKETLFNNSFFSFFLIPITAVFNSLLSLNSLLSEQRQRKPSQHKDTYYAVIRGAVIALPILFILFSLLTGADPIFRALASKISINPNEQFIISVILFIVCFVWGITVVKDRFSDKSIGEFLQIIGEKLAIESIVVIASAGVLFTAFLLVQLRFLFLHVPETELQTMGINIETYSEYVRQGFFQLLVAATIAGSLIAFVLQYLHATSVKHTLYLKFGLLILTFETELLLLSAGKRLFLYADAHGLTRSRIFGALFLVWLSLLLLILFIAVLKKTMPKQFFTAISVITIGAFLALNAIPIDSLIAAKYPPTVNNEIDYMYIASLSPETHAVWPSFVNHAQKEWELLSIAQNPTDDEMRKIYDLQRALLQINDKIYYLDRKYASDAVSYMPITNEAILSSYPFLKPERKWQTFNLSEYNAYLFIQKNKEVFIKVKPILEQISDKQQVLYNKQR